MPDKLRIGIVGCGSIAGSHISAYDNCDDVEIVAAYDVRAKAAVALAERTGARAAESLAEMVANDRLDVVSVCSPPAAHLDNCQPFLDAGIAIFCEKPLEVTAGRAVQLGDAVAASKSIFMTAFCHRFHPPIIELKRLIDAGALGEPMLFRNIFGGYRLMGDNHRSNPELSGGGCLIDHCCHSMDLFRYLVGDPTHAQALTANLIQDMRVEDFGMIHLSVGGRAFGEITSSYSLTACSNVVEWFGAKGRAVVNYFDPLQESLTYRVEGDDGWTAIDSSSHPDRFTGELRHFLECLRRGVEPSVTAADGVKANQIAAAVYQSAADGRLTPIAG